MQVTFSNVAKPGPGHQHQQNPGLGTSINKTRAWAPASTKPGPGHQHQQNIASIAIRINTVLYALFPSLFTSLALVVETCSYCDSCPRDQLPQNQLPRGQLPPDQRKYVQRDARLTTLFERFQNGECNLADYLAAV